MAVIRKLAAILAVAGGLGAGQAQAFYAWNGFAVERISADQMRVYPRGGLNPIDGWCAAGDYVIAVLNLPPATPIWLLTDLPRPRGGSLVFSLRPEGAASSNGLNVIGDAPVQVTAGAARGYCRQSIDYWTLR